MAADAAAVKEGFAQIWDKLDSWANALILLIPNIIVSIFVAALFFSFPGLPPRWSATQCAGGDASIWHACSQASPFGSGSSSASSW